MMALVYGNRGSPAVISERRTWQRVSWLIDWSRKKDKGAARAL
jgi:hypothetical protein